MRLPKFATANAGRWTPRDKPVAEAITAPPVQGDEPPHSTPRPACTLMRREQVWVAGRWVTIDDAVLDRWADGEPVVLLRLASGEVLSSEIAYMYVSRSEDEQALAAAQEACHGVG